MASRVVDLSYRDMVVLRLRGPPLCPHRHRGRCPLPPARPLSHHLRPVSLVLLENCLGVPWSRPGQVQVSVATSAALEISLKCTSSVQYFRLKSLMRSKIPWHPGC